MEVEKYYQCIAHIRINHVSVVLLEPVVFSCLQEFINWLAKFNLFLSSPLFLFLCVSAMYHSFYVSFHLFQVVNISIDREQKVLGVFPKVIFTDKGSYVESSTRAYDQLAFRYLSWLLYPLLIGYAIYSLLYQEHKGWYSWLLNMIYGFLLTFGK